MEDNLKYMRVIQDVRGGFGVSGEGTVKSGAVGKIISYDNSNLPPRHDDHVYVNIIGYGDRIFYRRYLESITEKQYFIGALSGKV